MKTVRTTRLDFDRFSDHPWTVKVMESADAGETFSFTGIEKAFTSSQEDELREFVKENRSPLRVHPLITEQIQRDFEVNYTGCREVPFICGYCGRACRQMGDPLGADRALCNGCPLRDYAGREEMRAFALS